MEKPGIYNIGLFLLKNSPMLAAGVSRDLINQTPAFDNSQLY